MAGFWSPFQRWHMRGLVIDCFSTPFSPVVVTSLHYNWGEGPIGLISTPQPLHCHWPGLVFLAIIVAVARRDPQVGSTLQRKLSLNGATLSGVVRLGGGIRSSCCLSHRNGKGQKGTERRDREAKKEKGLGCCVFLSVNCHHLTVQVVGCNHTNQLLLLENVGTCPPSPYGTI